MAIIEIRLRTFFTADECSAVPGTTVTIDSNEINEVPWVQVVEKLYAQLCGQLKDAPFTNLREMTGDEYETYREDEDA